MGVKGKGKRDGIQADVFISRRKWGDCRGAEQHQAGARVINASMIPSQTAFFEAGAETGKEGAGRKRSRSELPQAKTGEVGPISGRVVSGQDAASHLGFPT